MAFIHNGGVVTELLCSRPWNAKIFSHVCANSSSYPCRKPARDTLISVERNAILGNLDNRAFQLCSLNAISLRNKSTAFEDLVCDLSCLRYASPGSMILICDVRAWVKQDQLMLNDDKTEFLIIGTRQQLSKVSIQSIKVGQAEVSPVVSARNLGTWFDAHLDMGTHITKTCSITCTTYVILGNIYPENQLKN